MSGSTLLENPFQEPSTHEASEQEVDEQVDGLSDATGDLEMAADLSDGDTLGNQIAALPSPAADYDDEEEDDAAEKKKTTSKKKRPLVSNAALENEAEQEVSTGSAQKRPRVMTKTTNDDGVVSF